MLTTSDIEKGLMCHELSELLDNLSLLGKGDLKNLMKKLSCDEKKIKDFLVIIRSVDPKPGSHSCQRLQIYINQTF